jgi:hypothetical protein
MECRANSNGAISRVVPTGSLCQLRRNYFFNTTVTKNRQMTRGALTQALGSQRCFMTWLAILLSVSPEQRCLTSRS